MNESFARTRMLVGADGLHTLSQSHIIVFGIGGVGSYAVEALARCGVGHLTFIDYDTIAQSNINRQIHANISTVGMLKTDAMRARVLSVNPDVQVDIFPICATAENIPALLADGADYIVDAIDSVTSKLALAEYAYQNGLPLISSMGMANKLHPEQIELADLFSTSVCPLARVMRTELRKRGVAKLAVCYSREPALKPDARMDGETGRVLGSVSFVPSAAGLMIAGKVVRDICGLL